MNGVSRRLAKILCQWITLKIFGFMLQLAIILIDRWFLWKTSMLYYRISVPHRNKSLVFGDTDVGKKQASEEQKKKSCRDKGDHILNEKSVSKQGYNKWKQKCHPHREVVLWCVGSPPPPTAILFLFLSRCGAYSFTSSWGGLGMIPVLAIVRLFSFFTRLSSEVYMQP